MNEPDPVDPFQPRPAKTEDETPTPIDQVGTFAWPTTAKEEKSTREKPRAQFPWGAWLNAFWNHPVVRIAAYFAAFIIAAVVLKLALTPFGALLEKAPADADFPISTGFEAAAAVLALAFMVRVAEHRRMADAGFTFRGIVMETISGTMIGISVISVTFGLMALVGVYQIFGRNPAFHPALLLIGYLFAAIAEETIFRGFTFRVLEYRYGSFVALIVSALFFGLIHLMNESGLPLTSLQKVVGPLFISFEAGLLLGAAYMATRRLWLPIGIHWAWNYFEGPFYGGQVSGIGAGQAFLRASLHGRFLLTGGVFGPEASVICLVVCTLAGLLMLRVAVRAGQWHPTGQWQAASAERGASKSV